MLVKEAPSRLYQHPGFQLSVPRNPLTAFSFGSRVGIFWTRKKYALHLKAWAQYSLVPSPHFLSPSLSGKRGMEVLPSFSSLTSLSLSLCVATLCPDSLSSLQNTSTESFCPVFSAEQAIRSSGNFECAFQKLSCLQQQWMMALNSKLWCTRKFPSRL